jgi:O-antigen/teichoic acid export membrane protein
MSNLGISRNVVAAVLEVTITTLLLFVSYSYLVRTVGIGTMGIWSLVVGIVAFSQGADLGFSKSITRFVARSSAQGDIDVLVAYVATAFVTVLLFLLLAATILYFPLSMVLSLLLDEDASKIAIVLLPLSLLYLVISRTALVTLSALQGIQYTSTKSAIMTVGIIFQVFWMITLVPVYGIVGMVYAQVAQAGLTLVFSMIALCMHLPRVPIGSLKWSATLFKEIFSFGMRSQLISWLTICLEPVTKIFISQFGGVEVLGVFEVANRLVAQTTKLLVAANEVLFPAISDLRITGPEKVKEIYGKALSLTSVAGMIAFPALVCATPILSQVILGSENQMLVLMVALLSVGRFVNVQSGPAYFLGYGFGTLRPNIIGHALIAVSNITLAPLLGYLYGGIGVTLAASFSILVGNIYIRKKNEQLGDLGGLGHSSLWKWDYLLVGAFSAIWFFVVSLVLTKTSLMASMTSFVVLGFAYIAAMCVFIKEFRQTLKDLYRSFGILTGNQ